MNKVILASRNEGKIREIGEILSKFGMVAVSRDDYGIDKFEVEETGETFEENSYIKAKAILDIAGVPTIADDSGLEVDCIGGRPGVYSARFAGPGCTPYDNNVKLLGLMKHIPDKIMEKPETAVEKEALTQMPESMSWIYETEGISAEDGIKNSGGIENYIFSLKLFFDTIDDNAKVIKEAYDCDNIRLFTIKVHALKSSARIIGARDLSLFAEKLEDAGNIEDRSFIEENALLLLEEYEKFREKLKKVHEDADNNDKTMISDEELKDAFSALSDVIPQMDYDSVEMILDSLSEYQLPEDKEETVTELKRMLKVFDWDGMEALITKGA